MEKTVVGEPQAELILEKDSFPFDKLDTLFGKLKDKMTDGYVAARSGDAECYLFIVGDKPYCSALAGGGKGGAGLVRDFFTWYKEQEWVDIEIYKADKKLLLCILVRINFKATQSFSTEMVNLVDVVKRLEKQGKSAVMALEDEEGAGRGYAMFIGGRAIYVALQGEGAQGEPLEDLLTYSHNLTDEQVLTVEIYVDTKVAPAEDSKAVPEGVGAATFFTTPTTEAYLELVDEGETIDRYPITDDDLTIGREDTNAVFLEELGVSREQAVIRKKNDKYFIIDLESANGTFFKGIRIDEKELFDGDEINVRKYILRFHHPQKAEQEVSGDKVVEQVEEQAEEASVEELTTEAIYPDASVEPVEEAYDPDRGKAALVHKDGKVHSLGSITTLGKDKDSDIEVEGVLVAKRLATIIRGKDFFRIIKKGTLSTMKINDEKMNEHNLQDGDVIEVGGSTFRFRAAQKEED